MLLNQIMPMTIIGIYIAAVLSAIMSTVDSLLVVASSAVSRDFYQQIIRHDIDEGLLINLSKKVTLILAFLALAVAFFLIPSWDASRKSIFGVTDHQIISGFLITGVISSSSLSSTSSSSSSVSGSIKRSF